MKKTLILLIASFVVFSCKKENEEQFSITGKLDNSYNGKFAYIYADNLETGKEIIKDSVEVKNGTFELKGIQKDPIFATVFFKNPNEKFFDDKFPPAQIVLEPGEINIKSEKKDSLFVVKASGTPTNEDMNAYNKMVEPKIKELQKIQQSIKSEEEYLKVKNQLEKLDNELKNTADTYIKNNPKKVWSLLMISGKFQFEDTLEDIESLYNSLDADLKSTFVGQQVQNIILNRKKLSIGQKATDFKSKTHEGKDFSLNASLGKKITILDFWASWCGPCRGENPNLVKIYNQHKNKGFEIISYSLDEDENAWKNAIQQDQMTWKHASNLKGWKDEVAINYQIQSIPSLFILDHQGKIIAKNLRGEELQQKIAELLAN